MDLHEGMLPNPAKPGHLGYYPVTNKEEWEALPDLYKVMEWNPIKDPHSGQLRAIKAVIFDVPYMDPYGVRAKVSIHPEDVQKVLFCSFNNADCHLYSVCGVELEGGTRLSAKWLQDSISGSFAILANGECVGKQGGFRGFVPDHVQRTEDGSFKFDFKYGVGKTAYYALGNPFAWQKGDRSAGKDLDTSSLDDKISQATARSGQQKELPHSAKDSIGSR